MAYLPAILAGVLNTLQSGSNATLNEKLGAGPVVPALVVYAAGALGVLGGVLMVAGVGLVARF